LGACPAPCGNYNAQIARFHAIDPLTEKFSLQSPYVYVANYPIRVIDFLGLMATDPPEANNNPHLALHVALKKRKFDEWFV